ncbi:MAG: hypothetical protein AMJ64_10970 [Betaproteobacteria bacterium SG8_39]|nr:MAG: hypothetical protein AMJ64_10970 [Betaproteobacteria bacterium SG8_39]
MATNLPMPTYGTPSRGSPFTSGSDSGLSLASRFKPCGEISSGPICGTTLDRSRSLPAASIMPGFSKPFLP